MKSTKALFLMAVLIGAVIGAGCLGSTNASTPTKGKSFEGQTLTVCSGAGMIKPMNKLIKMFENETGAKVAVQYGGSSDIFGVLQTTCGCDVFIPGAWYYMEQAMKNGYILNGTVANLTYHIPVIAVPAGNPKGIHSLKDLTKPGVRVVLGDPKACAIGKVTKKILEKNGLWDKVKPNVVTFAPTVNQLLIYITTGQADAAIIWEDMVTWAQSKGKIEVVQIPPNENLIKTIPTAVTTCAKKDGHLKVAEAFNAFIANHTEVWEKWGFKPWKG
ncbi:molybdate ABC transporter substrate-binding protein [Thermococcus sp.]|uniref:molybdate ABC transporter substrate-binding protein n=1 Tax=Thermococcus sp. TaxID=35749 RepID=UPI00261485A8|nr:molybdate ABC transporter substrate-binding protein [Thermococcus sp.]